MHRNLPPRSSSPIYKDQTYTLKDLPAGLSFPKIDYLLEETGDSTRSLLAPLNDSTNSHTKEIKSSKKSCTEYKQEEEKENVSHNTDENSKTQSQTEKNHEVVSNQNRSRTLSSSSSSHTTSSSTSSSSSSDSSRDSSSYSSTTHSKSTLSPPFISMHEEQHGKSWDNWLREKAIHDFEKLKLKKAREKEIKEEKERIQMEKVKKHELSMQNRQEWLQKKSFEMEKARREKNAQKQYEMLKKQQEQDIIEQKAKENFEDWREKKKKEEKFRKMKLKKGRQIAELEKLNKKQQSEIAYNNWVKKARKSGTPKSQAINGSLLQYIHGETASPSFVNPIPWIDTISDSKNIKRHDAIKFSSPPMLWKERAKQQTPDNKYTRRNSRLKNQIPRRELRQDHLTEERMNLANVN